MLTVKSLILLVFTFFMIGSAIACRNEVCMNKRYPMPDEVPLPLEKHLSRSEKQFHENEMREAINWTKSKGSRFGATIVHQNGTRICYGVNQVGAQANPSLHGEIVTLNNCSALYRLPNYKEYYLYTTGEPCPMCASALIWAGFKKIIYAASIEQLYCDKCMGQILIDTNFVASFGNGIKNYEAPEIIGNILDQEALELFPNSCGLPNGVVPNCRPKRINHFDD